MMNFTLGNSNVESIFVDNNKIVEKVIVGDAVVYEAIKKHVTFTAQEANSTVSLTSVGYFK